jgi:hypothetical protein
MEYTGLCWYPRPKAHRPNMLPKNNTGATKDDGQRIKMIVEMKQ